MEREKEREGQRERERHAHASRKCGHALSSPHSYSQSVSMHDYYINVYTVTSMVVCGWVKPFVDLQPWTQIIYEVFQEKRVVLGRNELGGLCLTGDNLKVVWAEFSTLS